MVAIPDEQVGRGAQGVRDAQARRDATEEEIIALLPRAYRALQGPTAVEFGELPKTSTGKIQKFVLRDREWAARQSASTREGQSCVHYTLLRRCAMLDRAASGEVAMNAQELFLLRYHDSHPGTSRALLADLTDEQIRTPLCPGVNTLTWLVWHVARVEDISLNRFVSDGEQVFDGGGGAHGLGYPAATSAPASSHQVRDLSARIACVEALHAYWDAVEERTIAVVQSLHPEDLDTILDAAHVHRVFAHDAVVTPDALWVRECMEGESLGPHPPWD